MKELSIEEKAKAYDKLKVKAKQIYNKENDVLIMHTIEDLFPELKESEDEKIKKSLLDYLHTLPNHFSHNGGLVIDWIAWLERQKSGKPFSNGEDERIRNGLIGYFQAGKCEKVSSYHGISTTDIISWLEKVGKQKPADKVEPKFNVGDWLVHKDLVGVTCCITQIHAPHYYLTNNNSFIKFGEEDNYRPWTIQDAKDGDVLVNWNNTVFIFKAIEDETVKFHIAYNEKWDEIKTPSTKLSHLGLPEPQFEFHPATQEQRNTLMKAMADARYEWDAEKKELKGVLNALEECKIEHIEHGKYYYCIKDYYSGGCKRASKGEVVQALRGMNMMALGVKANEYFIPVKCIVDVKPDWSEEDETGLTNTIIMLKEGANLHFNKKDITKAVDWLKSLKERVQPQQEWSEEVSPYYDDICEILINLLHSETANINKNAVQKDLDWLKSLSPQKQWKPSEEQMGAFEHFVRSIGESGYASPYDNNTKLLYSLLSDLKKLKEE